MKKLNAAFIVILATLPVIAGTLAAIDCATPTKASTPAGPNAGPTALANLLARHDKEPGSVSKREIDAAAGQYGAVWSRLFWYTNLEDAQFAARAEGKPILYLRMMGKLTDEYSCANSRFFRTVLYANTNVSKLLREKFILVWESERPVPVITVDYGDGRTLKRTITGNSIHYVLNADGQIVDALPGLYDPVAFTSILEKAGEVARRGSESEARMHMSDAAANLNIAFNKDARAVGILASSAPAPRLVRPDANDAMNRTAGKSAVEMSLLRTASLEIAKVQSAPRADDAMRATMSKSGGERRLLLATTPRPNAREALATAEMKRQVEMPLADAVAIDSPSAIGDDWSTWQRIAALHLHDARLDPQSIELIKSQNLASSESELDATIRNFQASLAADTVRNNYEFRPRVLNWLLASSSLPTPREMNERVYGELFLTPRSDPWLGLAPENTYTALTDEGCSLAARP